MIAARIVAAVVLLLLPMVAHARPSESLIVHLAQGATLDPSAGRWEPLFPGHTAAGDPLAGFYRWTPPDGLTLAAGEVRLRAAVAVRSVEPDRVVPLSACTPSDPYFAHASPDSAQWPLHANPLGPDLEALDAWNVTTGDPDVVLAILDSGTDWHHPEFGPPLSPAGRIWFNPEEASGTPGVDDDHEGNGNGFVDDLRGWDFVDVSTIPGEINRVDPAEDGLTADNDPVDYDGHGTFVSGIAGAAMDDGVGMAGMAPGVYLMPLRVGWREDYVDGGGRRVVQGVVSMSFCAQAIVYAADNGARVLNCSWLSDETPEIVAALNYAIGMKGVVVVDAAGNGGLISTQSRNYLSRRGDCIEVAALARSGEVSGVTSIGGWVDISAPGENLLSLVKTGVSRLYRINEAGATSFAAPFVSATAALVRSVAPGMTPAEVRTHLMATVTDIYGIGVNSNALYLGKLGAGMVNAGKALEALVPASRTTLAAPLDPAPLVLSDGTLVGVDNERFLVTWATGSPARARLPLDGAIRGLASTRNGDVRLDVVTMANGHVAVLANGDFATGWPRPTGGLLFGDPILLELGGGAEPEIAVAGSDSLMYVWSLDGTSRPGFPARLPDAVLTSPAAGDLDGDGIPELVVVTADDRVSIVRMGGSVRNWSDANPAPLAGASHAPPILADVTGDGRLDVVLTGSDRVMALANPAGEAATFTSTWSSEDPLVGEVIAADLLQVGAFAIVTTHASGMVIIRPFGGLNGSPITPIDTDSDPAAAALAIPIDGNGETGLAVVTVDGCVRAFRATGEPVPGWPKRLAADAAGRWAAGSDPERDAPVLNVEAVDGTLQRFPLASPGPVVTIPWGMVGANPQRTRSVAPTTPAAPLDPDRPDLVDHPPALLASPNPARAGAPVTFAVPSGRAATSLVIHDVLGRVVRRIDSATNDDRSGVLSWDGRSDVGRPVAAGFYVARARFDDGTVASARFVVVR